MKRLIISILLSGLFLNSYATVIVVELLNGQKDPKTDVRGIQFKSQNTIECHFFSAHSQESKNVRSLVIDTYTAIDDVKAPNQHIKVYPNPTASALIIDGVEKDCAMQIYSLGGTMILSAVATQGVNTIDVSALPNGIYLLQLSDATFKFTKK